jgi:hypothetical protein
MLTQEKIHQSRKRLKRGFPEGEIKLELREEGYSEEEIKEIFKPKPYDMRSWFLFCGLLFTTIGFYFFIKQSEWHLLLFGGGILATYFALNARAKKSTHE